MAEDLVKQLLEDPNSTLTEADAEELAKLPQDMLQRLLMGMQTTQVSVTNEDTREADLKADLEACQEDIKMLIKTEQDIRTELKTFGVSTTSVVDQFVPVTNQEPQPVELTDEMVVHFINTSPSVAGQVLREAMRARKENRATAINTIITNSNGVYTEAELKRKFTEDLVKLADIVTQNKKKSEPVETTIYNWEGSGIADYSVTTTSSSQRYGGPLELPTTFQD